MEIARQPEIIDLTGSSPSVPVRFLGLTLDRDKDASTHPRSPGTAANGKKKPRKKKKNRSQSDENSQDNTVATMKEPFLEPKERSSAPKPPNASHTNRPRRSSPRPEDTSQLFFIDVTPVSMPPPVILPQPQTRENPQTSKLLLPSHVAVFEKEPLQILSPSQKEIGEEDYIEYLEFDEHRVNITLIFDSIEALTLLQDIPRYYEDKSKDENKLSKLVCKNCGAEGEHKTIACPVIVVRISSIGFAPIHYY